MGMDKIKKELKKLNSQNCIIRLWDYKDIKSNNYTEYDFKSIPEGYKKQFLEWFVLNADTTAKIKVDSIKTY